MFLREAKKGGEPKASVAKRPIKCWKVVCKSDGCYITPLRLELLSDDVIAGKCDLEAVGSGKVHSKPYITSKYYVGEGYTHTFSELAYAEYFISTLNLSAEHEIYECKIPVGTEYFKSIDGNEYASRSIRFIRKTENHVSDNE